MDAINPFEQPAPTHMLDRIRELARDLAFGATEGLWDTRIQWHRLRNPEISNIGKVYAKHLGEKWNNTYPSEYLLRSFGYVTEIDHERGESIYLLTDKAFSLLERPVAPPSVFISYRRSESSALALLIEARLKLVGNSNPYLDKNLVAGEDWEQQLEERIRGSRYFVCLVGKTTLDSPQVQQEIRWATEVGCNTISIWHGCKMREDAPDILKTRHAIFVSEESALGYETAINQLLNSMGYATY